MAEVRQLGSFPMDVAALLTTFTAAAVEALLNVRHTLKHTPNLLRPCLLYSQANPKLANQKDDDERCPIHWATSYGHLDIAKLLASRKDFDPDIQVSPNYEVAFNDNKAYT